MAAPSVLEQLSTAVPIGDTLSIGERNTKKLARTKMTNASIAETVKGFSDMKCADF